MDLAGIDSGVLTEENEMVSAEGSRNWHNRLRLRKAAVQPPTMQRKDKHGSKKITMDRDQHTKQTSFIIKSARKAQQSKHVTKTPGDMLRFRCSECKDSREFSPHELLGHFKEKHKASRPFFSCDMCTFNTHELSGLQVHVLSHKDTFASCIICNDRVQLTFLELTNHLDMHHKVNGLYACEECKFSSSDVGAFLEHMHLHSLALCENSGNSDHADLLCSREPDPKATNIPPCCPLSDYEATLNNKTTKHIATDFRPDRCHKSKQAIKKVYHKTVDESTPRLRQRMTRKTVREMCWMSQDCLSMPGKEFLDKYCNLSGPEKALEETQHFLERSMVGETGGENWTKAFQTVFSNVPQDITHYSMSENDTLSNPVFLNTGNDLTVLMVKNKISVPQNGSVAAVGLKMVEGKRNVVLKVTPSGKQETVPTETCSLDSCCRADLKTCQSNLDVPPQSQTKNLPRSLLFQNEFVEFNQSQENIDNQRVRFDQEDHPETGRQNEEPKNANHCENQPKDYKELKLTKRISEKEDKPTNKIGLTNRKRGRRRKAFRLKIMQKPSPGLKLLLKKDPVKEREWTSQGSLPVLGGSLLEDYHSLPHPQRTLEETQQYLHRVLTESSGQKLTKVTQADYHKISEALTPLSQSKQTENLIANMGHFSSKESDFKVLVTHNKTLDSHNCTTKDLKNHLAVNVTPLSERGAHNEMVEILPSFETGADHSSPDRSTNLSLSSSVEVKSQTNFKLPPDTSTSSDLSSPVENALFQDTSFSPENMKEDHQDGAKSNMERNTHPQFAMSPVSSTLGSLSLLQGMINLLDNPSHIPNDSAPQQNEPEVTAKQHKGISTGCPAPLSKANKPPCQSPDQEAHVSVRHWEAAPKHVERTMKIMPLFPTQLIKRPEGDQPVVVLNHPDAEIPEVTNIMEVVNRYKGEVQKVVLSQSTLNALSASDCEMAGGSGLIKSWSSSQRRVWPENSVKERFILKLRLKRMSKSKYKVVDVDSPSNVPPVNFSCWFCGRVFSNQEVWMSHGQRHLMEWKRRSCETENVTHTG